ncbi:MAG: hypothetical protein LBS00_11565 [Synergistaceae bacterium]|nr:hypothetical protein [Synergistaceae bacterium]
MSLVECMILMIVVGITFGAIFSTMAWATKSYVFSKQDKESRELFFSWIQTFESLWPGAYDDVDDAIEAASTMLGGTWSGGKTRIGSFVLTAVNSGLSGGSLGLKITIQAGGSNKNLVELTRFYNAFSNETVSDDTV